MQEIAFEIDAQRVGRASGYLGGLTIERYTFTGATIPPGTRLAILTRAGVTIAAAEIAEGNAATVDTNTQEVADLLRYQPLGACESVYIALGNADTILALIPATMRKNWLDDEATHQPVPANRYPTKTELDQWLARFDERAAQTAAAQSAAQAAATSASGSATEAKAAATDAGKSATAAADSAKDAGDSAVRAEDCERAAEDAQGAAEAAQRAAEDSATAASESAKVAEASEKAALSAKQAAETAQGQAKASETASKASETAAKGSETAASASEKAAAASEQAADESATSAKASEQASAKSEQAAAGSATAAKASEQASATSANASAVSATAAGKSADDAAKSATAAAKSATGLAEAVATAESLDGRIDKLYAGIGAYVIQPRDVVQHGRPEAKEVGNVLYFNHFSREKTSTIAVVNSVPFAQKIMPAAVSMNVKNFSAVGLFDAARNKKYILFVASINSYMVAYLYELTVGAANSSTLTFKSKLQSVADHDAISDPVHFCGHFCVHDGFVFFTHLPGGKLYLSVCDVETGALVSSLHLDPQPHNNAYIGSMIWYNPLTGHICVLSKYLSLSTGEAWAGRWIRAFRWNAQAAQLEDIPDGDAPATMINAADAIADGVGTFSDYGTVWPIRDQAFLTLVGNKYTGLFRATADDGIEPCYEWDVAYETGDDGITRPVWETQEEVWTDAEGNTKTIQNYVRNHAYDFCLRPKMTKGRLLKFLCAADYDGVPSGTWSSTPVFTLPATCYVRSNENALTDLRCTNPYSSVFILTDGVVRWGLLDGYKFVREEAFNNWLHLKEPAWANASYTPIRDEATGLYVINDIRKGPARKFTGWLPTSGQYLLSAGSYGVFKNNPFLEPTGHLVALTSSQSGSQLSRLGMVSNAGTDSAAMAPLPFTGVYPKNWWTASMLPYCEFGFFGNLWATNYVKTLGGNI